MRMIDDERGAVQVRLDELAEEPVQDPPGPSSGAGSIPWRTASDARADLERSDTSTPLSASASRNRIRGQGAARSTVWS